MLLRQLGKARVPPAPSNVLRARSGPGWKQVLVLVLSNIAAWRGGGRHVLFCKERGAEAEQKAEGREEGEEGLERISAAGHQDGMRVRARMHFAAGTWRAARRSARSCGP